MQVGKNVTIPDLEKKHDAVFLGVGLGNAHDLNIPGENLDGVQDALEFIEQVTTRKWSSVGVGKRVAVIGAGNTAIDAVTEAKRLGAEQVMIIYRRSKEEMPAYEFEFDLAKKDGVEFHFLTAPKRIVGTSHVEALECTKMKLGAPDAKGRRSPRPIPGTEFTLAVDMVVRAVGQKPVTEFLRAIPGLALNKGGTVVVNELHQTGNPKYFAGGDCTNGGKEVVDAVAEGMSAAHSLDAFLGRPRGDNGR